MKESKVIRSIAAVAAVAALGCAAFARLDGPYVPAIGRAMPGSADKDCGAYCTGNWYHLGYCLSSQNCCGWVNCGTGNGQNVCCNPGQTCSDGTQTNPPSQPQCS